MTNFFITHILFKLIKVSMLYLWKIYVAYLLTIVWNYFGWSLWDSCHSKEDFLAQIDSYNCHFTTTSWSQVWKVQSWSQWHWNLDSSSFSYIGVLLSLFQWSLRLYKDKLKQVARHKTWTYSDKAFGTFAKLSFFNFIVMIWSLKGNLKK